MRQAGHTTSDGRLPRSKRPRRRCCRTAFDFPGDARCAIGTEGEGTAPPGYSVFVIMSMLGPHQSLNVVTALMVALDELYADGSGIVSYLSNDDIPQT